MKKKRIKTIRAGGEDYEIRWDPDGAYLIKFGAEAMADHNSCIIYLHPSLKGRPLAILKALFHETFHTIEHVVNEDLDEDTLDRFAKGLAIVLTESGIINPEDYEFG